MIVVMVVMLVSRNLLEDGDDGQRGREDDERTDDRDVQLLEGQSDRTNVNLSAVVWVLLTTVWVLLTTVWTTMWV